MLYGKMILAYLRARCQYMKNFISSILAALPYQLTSFLVLWGVFSAFGGMGDWSYLDVLFLGVLLNIITGCANGFFKQFRFLENEIISGNLDVYLTRPRSVIFQLAAHEIDLFSIFGTVIPNLLIGLFCFGRMDILWTPRKILFLGEVILFGTLFYGAVFFFIGTLSFWFYRTNHTAMTLFYSVQDFVSYPLNIYGRGISFFLTFLFPLAFVNYYPLLSLKSGRLFPVEIAMALILLAAAGIDFLLWRAGLKRYQSAGS